MQKKRPLPLFLTATLFAALITAAAPAGAAHAADKAPTNPTPAKPTPAKAPSAAKPPAGAEVTLTGTLGCAKCTFKEAKQCQNVLKVKEGGKEVAYLVAQNDVAEAQHEAVCGGTTKTATVKGSVSEQGGKKVVTASEIKLQ